MSKVLVVFGATGQQGGSVIDFVLNDGSLSKQYKLRGITRNTSSPAAKALMKKGVEVVQADSEQPESLKAALHGAHTVFSNTTGVFDERLYEREILSGKAIADASVEAGAQYLIYSSSTPAGKITGRAVPQFDCKFEVEEYIKTLPIKSAFYIAATFMQNWATNQKPRPTGNAGEYAIANLIEPDKRIPVIDIVGDTGKFVGAVLAEPDKYLGQDFYAASQMMTLPEIAVSISKATGKTIKYNYFPEEVFGQFIPEERREILCSMMQYMNNPGYYGSETESRVSWTQAQARGKLNTFDDYLARDPISLD